MKNIYKRSWLARSFGEYLLWIVLALPQITACSAITPHDNFVLTMQSNIGKKVYDPRVKWMKEDRLIGKIKLTNRNIEYYYSLSQECHYYFEVDPRTDVIIKWRFEGNEHDCQIPN